MMRWIAFCVGLVYGALLGAVMLATMARRERSVLGERLRERRLKGGPGERAGDPVNHQ